MNTKWGTFSLARSQFRHCNNHKQSSDDESLVKVVASTAAGMVAPLCACLGGWAAQQCLVALTGKFTPVSQFVSFVFSFS